MKNMPQNVTCFILIIIGLILCCPFRLLPDDEIQYWHSHSISKNITGQWGAKLRLDYRFKDNVSPLFMHFTDYEVNYKCTPFFNVSANYRHIFNKSGSFHLEHRPHVNAALTWRKQPVSLKNRFRLEYRIRESGQTVWRLRDKFGFDVKMKIVDISCCPYIANEIFINGQTGAREKNWLLGGLKIPILKHYQFDISVMLQSIKKATQWENSCVIWSRICYGI